MRIWTTEEEAQNLKARFKAVKSRAKFARDFGVPGGDRMIYQHIDGRRPISLEAALAYAFGFNCGLEEISPRLALEAAKATAASNITPGPEIRGKLPLISWVKAGDLCESPDNFHPGDAEDWIDCPIPHSKGSYCLRVSGDSMDGEGGYRDGEIIFIDPAVAATPGRDVVVRTPDGKTTFKRLKEDTEGLYLFGINGKKIIRVPEGTHFCGVVIFSGFKR